MSQVTRDGSKGELVQLRPLAKAPSLAVVDQTIEDGQGSQGDPIRHNRKVAPPEPILPRNVIIVPLRLKEMQSSVKAVADWSVYRAFRDLKSKEPDNDCEHWARATARILQKDWPFLANIAYIVLESRLFAKDSLSSQVAVAAVEAVAVSLTVHGLRDATREEATAAMRQCSAMERNALLCSTSGDLDESARYRRILGDYVQNVLKRDGMRLESWEQESVSILTTYLWHAVKHQIFMPGRRSI
jgi:hypothetical protein